MNFGLILRDAPDPSDAEGGAKGEILHLSWTQVWTNQKVIFLYFDYLFFYFFIRQKTPFWVLKDSAKVSNDFTANDRFFQNLFFGFVNLM